jgi:hypothetical protein
MSSGGREPGQIGSYRTALAYVARGDDLAARIRLACILAVMALLPWLLGAAVVAAVAVFIAQAV